MSAAKKADTYLQDAREDYVALRRNVRKLMVRAQECMQQQGAETRDIRMMARKLRVIYLDLEDMRHGYEAELTKVDGPEASHG